MKRSISASNRRPVASSTAQDEQTGSPQSGEPVFLAVGKLRRPHGVSGEINMEIITDFPERIKIGVILYAGEEHSALTITSVRPNDQALLVAFEGYDNPEAVGAFRNEYVYIQAKNVPPLPPGHYYYHQLKDMQVVDAEGNLLGVLTDILETGANEVYVVTTPEGAELLLPVIENVILDINLEKREIQATPPAWL